MSAVKTREPAGVSRPVRPTPVLPIAVFAVVGGLAVWAIRGLDAKWSRLLDAPADMWTLLKLMFSNMSWSDLGTCLRAMWDSIAMAWLGTLFAAIFVLPLGIMAAENIVPRWFSFIVRQVFNVLRAVPEIIIVLAVIPVLGLSKSSGVLALGIGSIGSLSKLCADTIEGIDPGPIEAVDAVGASQLQRVRWAVLPQSLPEVASFILYRFEINIRVSAILGVVGAGGIGDLVQQNLKFRVWGMAGLGLIVMVVATIGVDFISGAVRRRLLSGPGGAGRLDLTAAQKGEALVDALAGGVAG